MGSLKQSWSKNWVAKVLTLNPIVTTNVPRGEGGKEGRRKEGGVGSVVESPPSVPPENHVIPRR